MKAKAKSTCVAILLVSACTSCGISSERIDVLSDATSPYDDLLTEFPPSVSVEPAAAVRYDYMKMAGSYSQHERAIESLLPIAKNMNSRALIAIYPDDPDLVAESDLTWQIGIEVRMPTDQSPGLHQRNSVKC